MLMSPTFEEFFNLVGRNGGHWFGHLPYIRQAICWSEDQINNRGLPAARWRKWLVRAIHLATGNSTFYINPATGSDAASGADWANAWKTITLGATAARIAAGDIIRIAKSPDPTSLGINGSWTNGSRTVTLASALTLVIENCADSWVAATNVTCTTSTTNKLGTNSASIAIASGFTTGKVAHEALAAGATDYSGYQQVSFWIRSSVAIAAGVLTLNLCSDTSGNTVVNTIPIPAIPGTNRWQCVTYNYGAALGSSIQSISMNAISDPGTPTILIDNIIACKAASSADSLTLTSLISKNSSAQGGSEAWYGIQSIDGTTVILDAETNTEAGVGEGYAGTTESVTTYKREPFVRDALASSSSTQNHITDSGTISSYIEYQGGYDTGSTTQNGETIFDGANGNGYGLECQGRSYSKVNWIGFCRLNNGFSTQDWSYAIIENSRAMNCGTGYSVQGGTSAASLQIGTIYGANNNTTGISFSSNMDNVKIDTVKNCDNNTTSGITFFAQYNPEISYVENCRNNLTGVTYSSGNSRIRTIVMSDNGTGFALARGIHDILSCTTSDSTIFGTPSVTGANAILSVYFPATGFLRINSDAANVVSETSTLTNGSGKQLKFDITGSGRHVQYPLIIPIAKIACATSAQVTFNVYCKKSHATNVAAKIVCRGRQIAGVTSDVTDTKADDTSEEQLTLTFTPSEAGVVEIEAHVWYVAGAANVIFDAITVTQA